MSDLNEAIKLGRKTLNNTPEDHPDWAKRLHHLGNRLENNLDGRLLMLHQKIIQTGQDI
ncbi:hypothetical protein BDV10DRAFT_190503 [Aspergillus recurvatus]